MSFTLSIGSASLFLRGLELPARLGVYPRERGIEQRIKLDIELGLVGVQQAASSDRLAETLDYDAVAQTARSVVAERHYSLVESLAAAIAERMLKAHPARWVRVRAEKLGCQTDGAGAGIELTAHRPSVGHPQAQPISELELPLSIAIVGGGVAGLSAALWVHRLGHRALVIDSGEELGGQLRFVHQPMPDIPGVEPLDGAAFSQRLWSQFAENGGCWLRARLRTIEQVADGVRLTIEGGKVPLLAEAAIVCTGIRRRGLDIGEDAYVGRGLLRTAARDVAHLRGRSVVVVGGGDSACENALILQKVGAKVTLVHRHDQPTARAQYREAIAASSVDVLKDSDVVALEGAGQLERVVIARGDETLTIAADAVLIRVGWRGGADAYPEQWVDAEGYLAVDAQARVAGQQRIFAAGDVIGGICPSVATAMGSGATAAHAACSWLELERER